MIVIGVDTHKRAHTLVALEVTTAADSAVVAQLKAAFGKEWRTPKLRNEWMVAIQEPAGRGRIPPIRKVMSGMIKIIEFFERVGETHVEVRYQPRYRPRPADRSDEMHEAMIAMYGLCVEVARLWSTPAPGNQGAIWPLIGGGVGSDSERLNTLVVELAERKLKKLARANAAEAHLCIWIDSSVGNAELAFSTLPPPPPPMIPAGIDVVWLVGLTGGPDIVRVWRLAPPGDWTVVPPPEGDSLSL